MEEIWKDVVGREGEYQVSNLGRVKSIKRKVPTWNAYKTIQEKILSQSSRNGYLRCICDNVHRIVAKAFLPIPNEFSLYVNHKNGNKKDNRVINLEWCTATENCVHAWETGLCDDSTRQKMSDKAKLRIGKKNSCWRGYIDIFDVDGNFVIQVESLKEAELWIKENTKYKLADKGNISRVCNLKLKKVYQHIFRLSKAKR